VRRGRIAGKAPIPNFITTLSSGKSSLAVDYLSATFKADTALIASKRSDTRGWFLYHILFGRLFSFLIDHHFSISATPTLAVAVRPPHAHNKIDIMSYAPPSGNPGTYSIYNQPGQLSGYSSSSDIEATNASVTDYSDVEAGYSSAASNSFDFGGYRPSQRMGAAPAYTHRRYNASQSPPAQIYTGIPTTGAAIQGQQALAGNPISPVNQVPGGAATSGQQYQRIARFVGPPPVALACTECRSRHLKCDAGAPSCSRCVTDKRECHYIKSRRGWKGTRRKKVQQAATQAGGGDVKNEDTTAASSVQSGTDTEGPDGGYSSGKSKLGLLFLSLSGILLGNAVAVRYPRGRLFTIISAASGMPSSFCLVFFTFLPFFLPQAGLSTRDYGTRSPSWRCVAVCVHSPLTGRCFYHHNSAEDPRRRRCFFYAIHGNVDLVRAPRLVPPLSSIALFILPCDTWLPACNYTPCAASSIQRLFSALLPCNLLPKIPAVLWVSVQAAAFHPGVVIWRHCLSKLRCKSESSLYPPSSSISCFPVISLFIDFATKIAGGHHIPSPSWCPHHARSFNQAPAEARQQKAGTDGMDTFEC
jgi:hypothetical protein